MTGQILFHISLAAPARSLVSAPLNPCFVFFPSPLSGPGPPLPPPLPSPSPLTCCLCQLPFARPSTWRLDQRLFSTEADERAIVRLRRNINPRPSVFVFRHIPAILILTPFFPSFFPLIQSDSPKIPVAVSPTCLFLFLYLIIAVSGVNAVWSAFQEMIPAVRNLSMQ